MSHNFEAQHYRMILCQTSVNINELRSSQSFLPAPEHLRGHISPPPLKHVKPLPAQKLPINPYLSTNCLFQVAQPVRQIQYSRYGTYSKNLSNLGVYLMIT